VLKGTAIITNTGGRAGKETLQVYIGKPDSDLEKPERELVFFEKTKTLEPGETEDICFVIPEDRLASYSEAMAAWVLDAGTYYVYAGNSAEAAEAVSFEISDRRILKKVKNRCVPPVAFTRFSKLNPEKTMPQGRLSGVVPGKDGFLPYARRHTYHAVFDTSVPEVSVTFDDVRKNPDLAPAFTAQFSNEELARLSVGASAGWGMEGIGEAGSLYQLPGRDLPKFPVSDGNSGVNINIRNIGMPSGFTLCASFNKELIEESGRVIGEEAKENGIAMILGPALNLHRNPLNGRQPEYFSEDPYLAGTMAGYYSKGVEEAGTASCMKHMICNNCESSRKRNQSVVSERALRELYFRAFEYLMEIHEPAAAMTAYNAVNGVPTAADADLILGLMREENHYKGFFMTDWTSYDTVDIQSMVNAGISWITPGSLDDTYTTPILKGVSEGSIDIARLRENITYLIRTVARFS
jgi:beta-glucosidase